MQEGRMALKKFYQYRRTGTGLKLKKITYCKRDASSQLALKFKGEKFHPNKCKQINCIMKNEKKIGRPASRTYVLKKPERIRMKKKV
jgi:hypothetical protein